MRRPPAPEHLKWLAFNGHDLAPLTGQDYRALAAVAACWQLYACGDSAGMSGALEAVRALLPAMCPHNRHLAKELIAFALDWPDRDRLWPEVAP